MSITTSKKTFLDKTELEYVQTLDLNSNRNSTSRQSKVSSPKSSEFHGTPKTLKFIKKQADLIKQLQSEIAALKNQAASIKQLGTTCCTTNNTCEETQLKKPIPVEIKSTCNKDLKDLAHDASIEGIS